MKSNSNSVSNQDPDLSIFIQELASFALKAESILKVIENDLEGKKDQFQIFYDKLFDIRATCQQLGLYQVSQFALLGEEIALKAASQTCERHALRKCVGSLWDAITSIKYLLEHPFDETTQEQEILMQRLNTTLKALGGPPSRVDTSDIASLLSTFSQKS